MTSYAIVDRSLSVQITRDGGIQPFLLGCNIVFSVIVTVMAPWRLRRFENILSWKELD
ncbi:hypothetical protein B932_2267 [Gluconobacter oxydans H24]|nr:hypothetical protein B932_2267 [Gluconobacter oxydans H24]